MGKGASSKDIRTHKFFIMGLTSQKQAKDIRLTKTLFLYLVFTRNVTPNKDTKQSAFVRDIRPILCFF